MSQTGKGLCAFLNVVLLTLFSSMSQTSKHSVVPACAEKCRYIPFPLQVSSLLAPWKFPKERELKIHVSNVVSQGSFCWRNINKHQQVSVGNLSSKLVVAITGLCAPTLCFHHSSLNVSSSEKQPLNVERDAQNGNIMERGCCWETDAAFSPCGYSICVQWSCLFSTSDLMFSCLL